MPTRQRYHTVDLSCGRPPPVVVFRRQPASGEHVGPTVVGAVSESVAVGYREREGALLSSALATVGRGDIGLCLKAEAASGK